MSDLPPLPGAAHGFYAVPMFTADQMRSYGEACAAAEREACATLAHNKALHCEDHDNPYGQGAALDIEDAIRARREKA